MVLKIQDYLGFDNTYANLLAKKETLLEPPYMVDVILRETPIAPELSFKSKPNSTNLICEYPRLTRNDKLKIELSKDYVDFYMKIRSNAFYTPYGTFFTDSSVSTDVKTITAQVKVKGKLVSSVQKIPFYWGKENVQITPSNKLYNKQLGRGWECLNKSNIVSEVSGENPVVEWIAGSDTIQVKCS